MNTNKAEADEVQLWFKRIDAAIKVKENWEKEYRVAECYQYWKGNQRQDPYDGSDRKAQHNKIHPDVAEQLPALLFYDPFGKVVAAPSREDTLGETVTEKSRLLQDTGVYLIKDPNVGFRDNVFNALKEGQWAFGVIEVGYSPDFIDNPMAQKPALREKESTKLMEDTENPSILAEMMPTGDHNNMISPEDMPISTGRDEMGLTIDENSDAESLVTELRRLKESLRGETFFVRQIPASHFLISSSNKSILAQNDWIGYWDDYPLEDVKNAPAYQQGIEGLKAQTEGKTDNLEDPGTDKVRLYRIWDLRTRTKRVFAKGHDKMLMNRPFDRNSLFIYRPDVDPNCFYPIPPVFLKLSSQDQYNDSAEYLRKTRIGTVPRYTYDEGAVDEDQVSKFQTREMQVMIPRHANTNNVIEPVQQPTTSATAIQTLSLSEKEFSQAGSASGDPLNPPTQTATRVVVANAKKSAQESFGRNVVALWVASIIEELILLAVDNMNIERWIAINVDMDSMFAEQEAQQVAKTYQQIDAERLRDTVAGINWHIEVDADTLSPVAEAERGMKLMQTVNFISQPPAAALLSQTPTLLKRVLSLGGLRNGGDVQAVLDALNIIVKMNTAMAMQKGAGPVGVTPTAGQEAGPVPAAPGPSTPLPQGIAGA